MGKIILVCKEIRCLSFHKYKQGRSDKKSNLKSRVKREEKTKKQESSSGFSSEVTERIRKICMILTWWNHTKSSDLSVKEERIRSIKILNKTSKYHQIINSCKIINDSCYSIGNSKLNGIINKNWISF